MTTTNALIPTVSTETAPLPRSRLRGADVLRVGTVGLFTRRLRTALTALGIGIGIAAMIGVVGISASSRAQLLDNLDKLGTDMLRVQPGTTFAGESADLPAWSKAAVKRIGPVTRTAGITTAKDAIVRRNPLVSPDVTNGIGVSAADPDLLAATSSELASGRFLDSSSPDLPGVVLGADAARRLGIYSTDAHPKVWISDAKGGGRWFAVLGILKPSPLAPELDSAALIGRGIAHAMFGTHDSPSTLFVRSKPAAVAGVRGVLARTLSPLAPNEVDVSRPSDALAARAATDTALRNLLLALGAVALVVGGVGITNVMVISVLERRSEIGVRRALGATKRHVLAQFVTEASLLSLLGGIIGCLLGTVVTAGYARSQGWRLDVPVAALAGGTGLALLVGLLAGISPAIRAARLDPAEAIRPA